MVALKLRVGQVVQTSEGRQGTVLYIGDIHVAPGQWCGLELPDDSGKNDGSVKGERYFECPPNHGIFVKKEAIVQILEEPTTSDATRATRPTNGSSTTQAAKGRPASMLSVESARKRQSVLSNSSGSQPGSRASVMVGCACKLEI